jgi:hypothetical protein
MWEGWRGGKFIYVTYEEGQVADVYFLGTVWV